MFLAAVGHDANNQIYPLAWAVVQSETGDNWLWFLQQLKADLKLQDGEGFVLISDKSKVCINIVTSLFVVTFLSTRIIVVMVLLLLYMHKKIQWDNAYDVYSYM